MVWFAVLIAVNPHPARSTFNRGLAHGHPNQSS
jgi:hypothetical protein